MHLSIHFYVSLPVYLCVSPSLYLSLSVSDPISITTMPITACQGSSMGLIGHQINCVTWWRESFSLLAVYPPVPFLKPSRQSTNEVLKLQRFEPRAAPRSRKVQRSKFPSTRGLLHCLSLEAFRVPQPLGLCSRHTQPLPVPSYLHMSVFLNGQLTFWTVDILT